MESEEPKLPAVRSIAWLGLSRSLKDKPPRVIEKRIHSQEVSLDPVACVPRLESPRNELPIANVANLDIVVLE